MAQVVVNNETDGEQGEAKKNSKENLQIVYFLTCKHVLFLLFTRFIVYFMDFGNQLVLGA